MWGLGERAGLVELGQAQRVPGPVISARVAARILARTQRRAASSAEPTMIEILGETLFHEQQRLRHPEDVQRAPADRAFYDELGRQLAHVEAGDELGLLRRVVEHYLAEIEGHFDRRAYVAATRIVPLGLAGLLHGFLPSQLIKQLPALPSADDQLVISGRVASLQALARRGTVILTPTHQSHLDSPLVGYAIYRMGLPPFVYGAGLNLFENPVLGFFLRRLGAYTVDRRKHDPLYREVLKEYATVSLELGQHHLFFPGGTRSRSGALETHLKKGLLGAGVAAFRNNLLAGKPAPRVFIVPCTCTLPLVLEAESLIEEYLQHEAEGRYIPLPDEADQLSHWVHLLRSLLVLDQRVHVRIGQALDPFGNRVDDEGNSSDLRGRPLDPASYLKRDDVVVEDEARDNEYTRYLAQQLVRTFHRDNTVLPTHVLAFAVLERLRTQQPSSDPVRFLRGLRGEGRLARLDVQQAVEQLRAELLQRAERQELQLDPSVAEGPAKRVIQRALDAFASYHGRCAIRAEGPELRVSDENLAYFYRNRLEGYGLLGAPSMSIGAER